MHYSKNILTAESHVLVDSRLKILQKCTQNKLKLCDIIICHDYDAKYLFIIQSL